MEFSTVLRSARLTLRCLEMGDAPALLEIRSDPDYAALMGWQPYVSPEDAAAYLRQTRANPDCLSWAAVLRETGETIGLVCLWHIDRITGSAELGYELRRKYRGQGFGAEAARVVTGYGLAVLGLGRIYARPRPENHASVRLLEKLGFRLAGSAPPTGADPVSHLIYQFGGTAGEPLFP